MIASAIQEATPMYDLVLTGIAVDIDRCQLTSEGDYILSRFDPEKHYCSQLRNLWIESVGRNRVTGEIRASTTTKFAEMAGYDCLFCR